MVDLFNVATSAWTTAKLSEARTNLAATFVGNRAIFAGGESDGAQTALVFCSRNCIDTVA